MVHKPRSVEQFFALGKEEQIATKRIPVVVYAPKYDEELRKEYEIEITDEGKFRINTTRVGQRIITDYVDEVDSYEEAREICFEKFFRDFNRLSEMAIATGISPLERVWDYSKEEREVKASISMVEGTKEIQVVEYTPTFVTIKIMENPPFILTLRELHSNYFEMIRKKHEKRLTRLKRIR